MSTIGPNERCPCGSGKKFKKCCDGPQVVHISSADRATALAGVEHFVETAFVEDEGVAWDEFYEEGEEELGENERSSEACFEGWFWFDRPLSDGRTVVRAMLDSDFPLTKGERQYLEQMRDSVMRVWEIMDVRPGTSMTLQDVLDGSRVTVLERTASRGVPLHEWIAARVNPRGPSGGAELELGVLPIPRLLHRQLLEGLQGDRKGYSGTTTAFFKELAPSFHHLWAQALLDPPVPTLQNRDGDTMTTTLVRFDVVDRELVAGALDRPATFQREEEGRWTWLGKDKAGELTMLGTLRLEGEDRLVLETNSVERGGRGRALLERAAGAGVRHAGTTHEDMQRQVKDGLRIGSGREPVGNGLPPDVNESMVLDFYARHYRKWLDEPVPALDDKTPRAAAGNPPLRSRLIDLLHGLVNLYQTALQNGEPAYDPSWMWEELRLPTDAEEPNPEHRQPPLLAHERICLLAPGAGEMCRAIARRSRSEPGFDPHATLTDEEFASELDVQRLIRENAWLGPHVRLLLNFEIHSRKTFWVDGALAWMLGKTDIDVPGSDLRLPFPSFALVFTDRPTLSCAERLLASQGASPLAGHLLRVLTVYVTEPSAHAIQVDLVMDALAADPPQIVRYTLALSDRTPVRQAILAALPTERLGAQVSTTVPLQSLLQVIVNAVLYATSAGVEPQVRPPRARPAASPSSTAPPELVASDEVYYLPGTIDISRLRQLRELERIEDGRVLLHRFMVRGHWRRPAAAHKEQRLRWIEPYWKGPDMAATIERAYRLKP